MYVKAPRNPLLRFTLQWMCRVFRGPLLLYTHVLGNIMKNTATRSSRKTLQVQEVSTPSWLNSRC